MISKISVEPASLLNEMLMCPYSLKYLSENGMQPSDPGVRGEHHDGCGMAFSKNGSLEIHKRSRDNAWDESYQQVARTATSTVFIAHNRLASKGLEMTEQGAHPFVLSAAGKTFALCHNGGVRNYMEEAQQLQTSDSYIFLRELIDPSGGNDQEAIFRRLSRIARECAYNSLCAYLITDDELYAWRIYSMSDTEKIPGFEKYYTLYMSMRNNSVVFSSEPLDDSPWMLLENNTFLHLRSNGTSLSVNYRSI